MLGNTRPSGIGAWCSNSSTSSSSTLTSFSGFACATTSSPMYCSAPLSSAAQPSPSESPGPSSTTTRGAKDGIALAMIDRCRSQTE